MEAIAGLVADKRQELRSLSKIKAHIARKERRIVDQAKLIEYYMLAVKRLSPDSVLDDFVEENLVWSVESTSSLTLPYLYRKYSEWHELEFEPIVPRKTIGDFKEYMANRFVPTPMTIPSYMGLSVRGCESTTDDAASALLRDSRCDLYEKPRLEMTEGWPRYTNPDPEHTWADWEM